MASVELQDAIGQEHPRSGLPQLLVACVCSILDWGSSLVSLVGDETKGAVEQLGTYTLFPV